MLQIRYQFLDTICLMHGLFSQPRKAGLFSLAHTQVPDLLCITVGILVSLFPENERPSMLARQRNHVSCIVRPVILYGTE